jgi:hypothetical protein
VSPAGRTRSAIQQTSSTARRTSKEALGQTKAQVKRTGEAAQSSTANLLDDARPAVEPTNDGKPASLENGSKPDLYERAQDLAIDGRSTMTEQQLVSAIRSEWPRDEARTRLEIRGVDGSDATFVLRPVCDGSVVR